jgi:UDP-2,3-diacylglucosamine pyrophosphatase LpxH
MSIVAAVRTLIVSDLHLGQRPGHDVLRRPEPLTRLLGALAEIDRLVLLGDVVELGSKLSARRPMAAAAPILGAIGRRMAGGEIVVVPGNHDAVMVRQWALARGRELGLADDVPLDATPSLKAVTALLSPAPVRVSYPGVWVGDRIWATHGHYMDRHLMPETTFGLRRRDVGAGRPAGTPIDYEHSRSHRGRRRPRQEGDGLLGHLRERPLAVVLETAAELTRYGTRLLRAIRLTQLTSTIIDLQMRRASVPAMVEVARRLGIDADWLVYGHVHRLGPLAGERWQPIPDGPQVLNTGSWVYEPLLLDGASPPHPYWPGGSVLVEDGQPPRPAGLLDDLPGDAFSR